MKLPILLIAVISTAWAETEKVERRIRAPQEAIRSRNNGANVNFRYLSQQDQSYADNFQRFQHKNEGGVSTHRQRQTQQQRAPAQQAHQEQLEQIPQSQYYQPYSALPGHIRQLIEHTYQPQPPYVDPTSFIYGRGYTGAPQQQEQQHAVSTNFAPHAAAPSTRYQSINSQKTQFNPILEYTDRRVERQNRVPYKEHQQQQQYQEQEQQPYRQQQQYGQATLQTEVFEFPLPILSFDKNMPNEIKQLLQYQAQIPYDVTANHIQYRPKNLFIPKPLSDDVKGPYYYRSKVYYMNENGEEQDDKQQESVSLIQ